MTGAQNPSGCDVTEAKSSRCNPFQKQKTLSSKARFPGY